MWRKTIFISWAILLTLVLVACGAMASSEPMAMAPAEMDRAYEEMSTGSSAPADGLAANQAVSEQSQIPEQRLIIRTGNLSLVVENPEVQLKDIATLATQLNGWVVSSNVYQYSTAKRGEITIRIPAERFDETMEKIKALALEVVSESSSGQDVTEEYVDLSSRLTNLEATAERVRGFLDDAQTVEEALAANVELSRLEGEIEVIKGRMQYLSQSAAFSTITVSLEPDFPSQPIEVAGWRPDGVAKEAIEALINSLQGLADITIWLVIYFLPMLLLFVVVGAIVFYSGRWVKRKVWG